MEHVDHILIVDDDREIRELVGNYLKKNGLRTTVVADGRQMRSFLDANTVDLIVLDIMMPGDDGLQLCRELRVGKHKATPVLMLTARNDETDRIIGLEMGADDYLSKPFAARELLARINAVLRRTRMLPPKPDACWRSVVGSWTPRPATCSTATAPWLPSAAPNTACCGCSSTIRNGCSAAINCST
jgi:DNA-binding response OmpR family regulator